MRPSQAYLQRTGRLVGVGIHRGYEFGYECGLSVVLTTRRPGRWRG